MHLSSNDQLKPMVPFTQGTMFAWGCWLQLSTFMLPTSIFELDSEFHQGQILIVKNQWLSFPLCLYNSTVPKSSKPASNFILFIFAVSQVLFLTVKLYHSHLPSPFSASQSFSQPFLNICCNSDPATLSQLMEWFWKLLYFNKKM
jgi:hypothetical protein